VSKSNVAIDNVMDAKVRKAEVSNDIHNLENENGVKNDNERNDWENNNDLMLIISKK
jgi:hypothetical protein